MKRTRQSDEQEQETPARRGQRLRKPTKKLLDNVPATETGGTSSSTDTSKRRKLGPKGSATVTSQMEDSIIGEVENSPETDTATENLDLASGMKDNISDGTQHYISENTSGEAKSTNYKNTEVSEVHNPARSFISQDQCLSKEQFEKLNESHQFGSVANTTNKITVLSLPVAISSTMSATDIDKVSKSLPHQVNDEEASASHGIVEDRMSSFHDSEATFSQSSIVETTDNTEEDENVDKDESQTSGQKETDPVLRSKGSPQQGKDEGKLDASETFITIETKDGLSSERIPISQFLKKVVVDRESGNLKFDLGLLLGGNVTGDVAIPNEVMTSHVSDAQGTAGSSTATKADQSKTQVMTSDKPVKRRGRPPKQKPVPSSTDTQSKAKTSSSATSLEVVKSKNSSDSSKVIASVETAAASSQLKEKRDFMHTPRRSGRTPAKNSRFGDDFVDSITLGKVASTTSTWNTQLMTLALAAERHESKPQRSASNEASEIKEQSTVEDADDYDDDSTSKGSFNSDDKLRVRKRKDDVTKQQDQRRFISIRTSNSNTSSEEKKKKITSAGLRGPKTKKYDPVDPVVQRSLQEAFSYTSEACRNYLSTETPQAEDTDNTNESAYFTIMEPKIDPSGQGLLIHKAGNKINFNIVHFEGKCTDDKFSKSYPQDRYFTCDLCDDVFPSSNSWLQHNKIVHNRTVNTFEGSSGSAVDKSEHKCEFCGQKFPYKFMLDIHIKRKRHSEVKTFRCTLCKEIFATHKAREEHWMISHPARSCGLCGKQFTNIVMLRRHINHNCHGARFRKRTSGGEVSAEEQMVVNRGVTNSSTENMNDDNGSDVDDVTKETDVEGGDVDDDDNDDDDEHFDSRGVKIKNEKVKCESCGTEFSTYSGLWHHKLEEHHEFYPQGYKDKLKEKFDKNQNLIFNAQDADHHKAIDNNKNKFFVLLKPKWPESKSKLSISVDDKDFVFKPKPEKQNSLTSLPQNSVADSPPDKETSFDCMQCGETFQFASNYREHRSRVHGECFEVLRLLGAFQCTLCSETYPCQFMLDKHLKKHVGKKLLPCTLCGLFFHKIQERRLHWKTVHPGIGCPNCGKMYASIKYLQKHISLNCQDHFPPTKKFLEFQKKQHSDFEMSKSEKKVEKRIIQCHLCPKLCSSVHGWRRHMSEAHEDAGFSKLSNTCIICNELVYGYKALEKHLLENHSVESGLPVEEEDTMVEEALQKCDMDITAYRKAGKNNTDIYQDEEGNYHCPSCPKTHPDLRALRTHIRIHVNMKLECSICNKTFKNPTLLKQHVQRHRKDAVYTCDTCGKKFLTLQKLNKHRKVHHSTGNFVCELCGMSFALNDYLQKHKRCHTDKRPHYCTVCGKTFRTKPELRVHILIHTRESPYKCQYCNRGFSQKGNYRIHLAQHTGEKPYQCDQCEISFALLCHLKRHKVTHDQKINYRCIWCDKECTQRKHMQMHVQRVHKEDFYHFEEQMKLETPIPIAPSQAKLYNRRVGKINKIRRQYRTRAQKCDSTMQQLINGIVPKSEPMDEDTETSQNIVIEPFVEPMVETVASDIPVGATDSGAFEILVSEDHQNYAKQNIAADLIGQDPSNVEIVMGENNEINIIIKDSAALQDAGLGHLSTSTIQVHESLQHAVEALVSNSKGIVEDDSSVSLSMADLDKNISAEHSQILNYDSASTE